MRSVAQRLFGSSAALQPRAVTRERGGSATPSPRFEMRGRLYDCGPGVPYCLTFLRAARRAIPAESSRQGGPPWTDSCLTSAGAARKVPDSHGYL